MHQVIAAVQDVSRPAHSFARTLRLLSQAIDSDPEQLAEILADSQGIP